MASDPDDAFSPATGEQPPVAVTGQPRSLPVLRQFCITFREDDEDELEVQTWSLLCLHQLLTCWFWFQIKGHRCHLHHHWDSFPSLVCPCGQTLSADLTLGGSQFVNLT